MQPAPQQPPQVIQPQPVPESWVVNVLSNGSVMIEIHHPSGVHVSFLRGDDALSIGNQIITMGRQAKSGLIITDHMPPLNGNGGG